VAQQHYDHTAAGLVRPMPDKYALATDKQVISINKQDTA